MTLLWWHPYAFLWLFTEEYSGAYTYTYTYTHTYTYTYSAGKPWVIAVMWMWLDMHHPPKHHRQPCTALKALVLPDGSDPTAEQCAQPHHQNCSGMAGGIWQRAQEFPWFQSDWASVEHPRTNPIHGGPAVEAWKQERGAWHQDVGSRSFEFFELLGGPMWLRLVPAYPTYVQLDWELLLGCLRYLNACWSNSDCPPNFMEFME